MQTRPKGTPKTGGRKKGTPNKRSLAQQSKAAKGGIMPLDYMLKVLRAPLPKVKDPEERRFQQARKDKMADWAAPYLHPKLMPVNKTGGNEIPIALTDENGVIEKARRVAFVIAQGARAAKAAKKMVKA